jgi:hypothetical protein
VIASGLGAPMARRRAPGAAPARLNARRLAAVQTANSRRVWTTTARSPVLPEVLATRYSPRKGSAASAPVSMWAFRSSRRSRESQTISSKRSISVALGSVGSSSSGASGAFGPSVRR